MVTFATKEKWLHQTIDHLILRSIDPDCQFHSVMICVLLLPEGNLLENMEVAL
jgi:hypothetical protein